MIEQFTKLNPKPSNYQSSGGKSHSDITVQELLIGTQGCKPHYVQLYIDWFMFTPKYKEVLREYSLAAADQQKICDDCVDRYKHNNQMLIQAKKGQRRKLLTVTEVENLAKCAVYNKIVNLSQDIDYANFLLVSIDKFRSKYRAQLDICIIMIEEEIIEIERIINKRRK